MRYLAFLAMFSCAAFCSAQLTLAAPTAKASNTVAAPWTALNCPEIGFVAKIPAPAERKDGWNLLGTTHKWNVRSNGSTYSIGIQEANTITAWLNNSEEARTGILEGFPGGFFQAIELSSHGKIESAKMVREFDFNGYPAKEYTYSFLAKDGISRYAGRSIFCVNEKYLYAFTAFSGSKPDPTVPFFASIKIK